MPSTVHERRAMSGSASYPGDSMNHPGILLIGHRPLISRLPDCDMSQMKIPQITEEMGTSSRARRSRWATMLLLEEYVRSRGGNNQSAVCTLEEIKAFAREISAPDEWPYPPSSIVNTIKALPGRPKSGIRVRKFGEVHYRIEICNEG